MSTHHYVDSSPSRRIHLLKRAAYWLAKAHLFLLRIVGKLLGVPTWNFRVESVVYLLTMGIGGSSQRMAFRRAEIRQLFEGMAHLSSGDALDLVAEQHLKGPIPMGIPERFSVEEEQARYDWEAKNHPDDRRPTPPTW